MRLCDYLHQQGVPSSPAVIRGVAEWFETYAKVPPPAADVLREQASFWDIS